MGENNSKTNNACICRLKKLINLCEVIKKYCEKILFDSCVIILASMMEDNSVHNGRKSKLPAIVSVSLSPT